ncbi:MAG: serine hydroxymethyltransferase [Oscillospiraceae bacterium]|nr:serine hydroxymethyltransferase [Oscillospiraceae bacterium]
MDYKKIITGKNLSTFDLEVSKNIQDEYIRQEKTIELIASENIASENIMLTMATVLTNKYAEGYPNKRYYGGCTYVDNIENLAIDRAKDLFKAEYANVQPHSGSQANMAVYFALLEKGDTVLGMDLNSGGHLTHGLGINFSGRDYNFIGYSVDEQTHLIDYTKVRDLAKKHSPKMIVAGASAYTRHIDFKRFKDIADEVGAILMVDMAHIAGLVAAGVHPSPIEYADVVTSTTHKTLRGPRGGIILGKKEIGAKIDKAIFPGIQGGPLMHVIAGKAVCFKEASTKEFKLYQKQVILNAKSLENNLRAKGFNLISNGTDNHMLLIDLTNFNVTGKEIEKQLDLVDITVNKNTIPSEKLSPMVTSGIRIGTPAITTRGFVEKDMEIISECLYLAVTDFENSIKIIKEKVFDLCNIYPIYIN